MFAAVSRSFNSLEVPNYRRYFAGQVVSISGNWMQIVAEMWLIVREEIKAQPHVRALTEFLASYIRDTMSSAAPGT